VDNKDRFGSKLHDAERAREDQHAAERDRELLEKLRKKKSELGAIKGKTDATEGVCPRCQRTLLAKPFGKVTMMACPQDDGAWFDEEALKVVLATLD